MVNLIPKIFFYICTGAFVKGISGSCPVPFVRWNGHCYLFKYEYTDNVEWGTAASLCLTYTSNKGSLVTILSPEEQTFIFTYIRNMSPWMNVWIGLYKVHTGLAYIWVDGTPAAYTNWGFGAPNEMDGTQNCVLFYGTNGLWDDVDCNLVFASKGYICKYRLDGSTSSTLQTPSFSTPLVNTSTTTPDTGDPGPGGNPGCCNAGQVVGLTLAFLALISIIVAAVYIVQRARSGRGLPFFYKPDGAPARNQQTAQDHTSSGIQPDAIPPDNSISNPNYETPVLTKDCDA